MTTQGEHRDNLDDLLEDFRQGMLVTQAPDGALRSRPMALAEGDLEDSNVLLFVTSVDSAKTEEIEAHPEVNVSFQGSGSYVSVSGRAKVMHNPALAQEIWSPMMKVWFPNGPGDPELRIIEVRAHTAEYWDQNTLRFLWEAGKALVQGEAIDSEDATGEDGHGKVSL